MGSTLNEPLIAPNIHDNEVIEPPPNNSVSEDARAKHCKFGIMKIRHLKMKKHKQKKLLKKMYFVWKKDKERKEARALAAHLRDLTAIKKTGDDFDANSYVKEQLQKARKGGYGINIFKSSPPQM